VKRNGDVPASGALTRVTYVGIKLASEQRVRSRFSFRETIFPLSEADFLPRGALDDHDKSPASEERFVVSQLIFSSETETDRRSRSPRILGAHSFRKPEISRAIWVLATVVGGVK
jgi:hypothetical protein